MAAVLLILLYSFLVAALLTCVNGVGRGIGGIELTFIKSKSAVVNKDSDVSLSVFPDRLITSGDWATVTWSGVVKPDSDDWIGLYPLPTGQDSIDPNARVPIKYQFCRDSPTHISHGYGSLQFYMINMRVPYMFGLFRQGLDKPVLVAISSAIEFFNPNEPLQGHLILTEDPTKMKLAWVTRDIGNPHVRYGSIDGVVHISKATSVTYSASSMCGSPATDIGYLDPGQIHTAVMENLVPGQKVLYRFGDSTYGMSKIYNFTVPPRPDPSATIRLIVLGDMGRGRYDTASYIKFTRAPSKNTTMLIEQEMSSVDTVLHIGDLSYAIGYGEVWEEFLDQIQPIATHIPYMVCPGNHESDFPNSGSYYTSQDSGGECGVPYELRFPMPRTSRNQDWYTFKMGSVQVVLMSTEHNFTQGSVQYRWIKNTLEMVDRSITPWLIFVGHRPMYVDSKRTSDQSGPKELRIHIESLLMQYKVDIALWGHHHSYQRTCPVYKEKCAKEAPVHLVIGNAGQGLSRNIQPQKPSWIAHTDFEHYGYSRITINGTSLVFEYVRDDDGQVHDTLVLEKEADNEATLNWIEWLRMLFHKYF